MEGPGRTSPYPGKAALIERIVAAAKAGAERPWLADAAVASRSNWTLRCPGRAAHDELGRGAVERGRRLAGARATSSIVTCVVSGRSSPAWFSGRHRPGSRPEQRLKRS